MQFQKNINIWNDTIKKCSNIPKPPKSIKYTLLTQNITPKFKNTHISIQNIDSIDCAHILQKNGLNPVTLNMADNNFPGGQVYLGSGAQEESLFRRTNYFQTLNLETNFYPLKNEELIYSPQVTIIKDKNGNDLQQYYNLSFIACPGIKKPNLENNQFNNNDKMLFINKIKNILNTAYIHNHDSIVLSALGCGAWECPPEEVALLFKETITEYKNAFKCIIFAILEVDKNNYIVKNNNLNNSNFQIFSKIFNQSTL